MNTNEEKRKEEERKIREKRETPIIDGDARPDMNISPGDEKTGVPENKKADEKLTKERGADVNTTEDYRDAN